MDVHPSVKTKIEAICQAIRQYPERKYYITDLAKQAGLTPSTFNQAFKQYLGISLPQCVTKAKMERAMEMLLAHHSIKQVTAALGYKQVINFHKTFKRFTGLTPRQYYLRNKKA
jgi:AraC-like DNA-binding protein